MEVEVEAIVGVWETGFSKAVAWLSVIVVDADDELGLFEGTFHDFIPFALRAKNLCLAGMQLKV